MDINVVGLIVTVIVACVAWWANETLNSVPILKTVVKVIIVVVALLCLWAALGVRNHTISVG